ncbi:MAG: hypothetical protein E7206_10560 [Clostridium beijerinckii]|nr:hypothetical protein [Clostridium beijerinckii]
MIFDKETITAIGVILTAGISLLNLLANIEQNKKKEFINTVTSSRIKWISDVRETITEYITAIPKYNYYLLDKLMDSKTIDIPQIISESFNIDRLIKINSKLKLLLNKDGVEDKEILKKSENVYNDVLQIKLLLDMYTTLEDDDVDKFSDNLHKDICNIMIEQIPSMDFEEFGIDLNNQKKISKYFQKYNMKYKRNHINRTIEIILNDKVRKLSNELIDICQSYLKKEWERVKNESESGNLSEKKINKLRYLSYLRYGIIGAMILGIIILIA